MKILLDIDGVLLNYTQGLDLFASEVFGYKLVNPHTYHLRERYDISPSNEKLLGLAFERTVHFQRLSPIPQATRAIRLLFEQGHSLRCVSAASNHTDVLTSRMINLTNVFGPVFASLTHVGWGNDKKEFFHDPEEVLVEDSWKNIEHAHECGYTKTILLKQPHGAAWNHNDGVDNWSEVLHRIARFEEQE